MWGIKVQTSPLKPGKIQKASVSVPPMGSAEAFIKVNYSPTSSFAQSCRLAFLSTDVNPENTPWSAFYLPPQFQFPKERDCNTDITKLVILFVCFPRCRSEEWEVLRSDSFHLSSFFPGEIERMGLQEVLFRKTHRINLMWLQSKVILNL